MMQNKNYKQLIIARKDLNMSPGKLAAQVSHASMAFLTSQIKEKAYQETDNYMTLSCKDFINGEPCVKLYRHPDLMYFSQKSFDEGKDEFYLKRNGYHLEECSKDEIEINYKARLTFDKDLYENWIEGSFTKVVCGARNLNQLMRVTKVAADLGLKEGVDYFLIKDNCLTELEPEEVDENGVGRTTTCIGFVPLPVDIASQLSKKYQLY
jgi:PTH2 family peptidyl-tRNA hydrolase